MPHKPLSTDHIGNYIAQSASIIFTLENQIDSIHAISKLLIKTLKAGRTLLTCGNGGSAAEAMHLAEELTGKYNKNRRALPAISLCSDASAMTCIANDWDFTYVFSRQVEAFARKGDLLLMFTTSGNSTNCLRAAHAMKKAGGAVVGLLGKGGGKAKSLCDLSVIIDSQHTNHIQEAHQVILHLLLESIDAEFA
ncbi:MAG TPA: SIS domain-containing protein [Phycisphaerae bacterium]|nr:SIS domain-containing protein [Phycisphaerae bacterium]